MKKIISKTHFVKSSNFEADLRPTIAVIPGGPCFSSLTLRDLEPLKDNFHLAFIDPPGTGGTEDLDPVTYEGLIDDIESAILTIGKPVILLGHSFGGIQAAEIKECKASILRIETKR